MKHPLFATVLFFSLAVYAAGAGGATGTAGSAGTGGAAGEGTVPAARDSLDALKATLTSEWNGKGEMHILKDRRMADTLMRLQAPGGRERFDRLLLDSSRFAPVRTPEEFQSYWRKVEAEAGIGELRGRQAAQDLDRSRVPRAYLFDSSVVVYPGIIVVRRKLARSAPGR